MKEAGKVKNQCEIQDKPNFLLTAMVANYKNSGENPGSAERAFFIQHQKTLLIYDGERKHLVHVQNV